MLNLEPIKERLQKATPAPWDFDKYSSESLNGLCFVYRVVDDGRWLTICHRANWQDVEFIARAPQDVAALVAEVERLREQNQVLAMAIKDHYDVWRTGNDRLRLTQNKWLWRTIDITEDDTGSAHG